MINPERMEPAIVGGSEYNYDIQNDGDLIEVTGSENPEDEGGLVNVACNICEGLGYHLLPEDKLALQEGDSVDFHQYSIEIRDNRIKILLNETDNDADQVEMEEAVEAAIN